MSAVRPRRRVIERVFRWSASVLSALFAAAWAASAVWTLFFMAQFGDTIGLSAGCAEYLWTSAALRRKHVEEFGAEPEPHWQPHYARRQFPMEWLPSLYAATPSGRAMVTVPIWAPFIVTSGASAWLWRRHVRRPRPGCCPKCRYAMGGLPVGAPCPECGHVVESQGAASAANS